MPRVIQMPTPKVITERLKLQPERASSQHGRMFDATYRRDQKTGVYMIGAPLHPSLQDGRRGRVVRSSVRVVERKAA